MNICPSCQHREVEGALFCSECGTSLQEYSTQSITSNSLNQETLDVLSNNNMQPPAQSVKGGLQSASALQVLDGGQLLSLSGRNEFTMGRVSEGQPVLPDIDLTPYNAYQKGVSRVHAVLRRDKNKAIIMDLGSSNGTYLNGVRLQPEQEYPISHGNILSLGKLKLQFLMNQ